MSMLPDECIFYILNICRWDWFHDDVESMRQRRKREKVRLQEKKAAAAQTAVMQRAATAALPGKIAEDEQKMSATCKRRCKTDRDHGKGEDDARETVHEDDVDMEGEEEDDEDDEAFEAFGSENEDDEEDDEEEEEEQEDDEEDDEDEEMWVDDSHSHRANVDAFTFNDVDSGEEESDSEPEAVEYNRSNWMRRQFARIHALRALASIEDGEVAHFQF